MTNEYRPLFNRKYITGLMWFSLIAILILTSMGPGDVEYQTVETNDKQTIYWMELDDQPIQLVLLLPTTPALNPIQQQLQQLKSLVIQQRLRSLSSPIYSYTVTPRADRIEIGLHWAMGQELPNLTEIWDTLRAPVEASRWEEANKTLQARHYLEAQSSEQQLINRFYQQLQPPNTDSALNLLTEAYAELFIRPRYAISGDDAEDYIETIEQQLPQSTSITTPQQTNISNGDLVRETNTHNSYQLLLGKQISHRASEQFVAQRLTAQTLQDLLNEYKDQNKLSFRLLWAALETTGYQAIILGGQQNPGPILPQLQQLISDDLVESSQNRLAAAWQERMRDNKNQVQALTLIAFYRLPTDTMESYIEQIMDLDTDDIIEMTKQALKPSQQISIIQSPAL